MIWIQTQMDKNYGNKNMIWLLDVYCLTSGKQYFKFNNI